MSLTVCRGTYPTTTHPRGAPTDLRVGDRVHIDDGPDSYDGEITALMGRPCRLIRVHVSELLTLDVEWPAPFDVTLTRI